MINGQRKQGKKIKLSVITVVYNAVSQIDATMQSVFSQSMRGDIEYIVMDGFSSDGTVDVIRGREKEIDVWQSEPDEGIYDAMNKGVALASGRWIQFLNAGDQLLPLCPKIWALMDDDLALISGDTILYGENGEDESVSGRKYDGTELGLGRYGLFHQSIFYRKKYLPTFDIAYRIIADGLATWQMISACGASKSVHIKSPVSRYLRGGVSANILKMNLEDLRAIRQVWSRCTLRQRFYFSKRYVRSCASVFVRSLLRAVRI